MSNITLYLNILIIINFKNLINFAYSSPSSLFFSSNSLSNSEVSSPSLVTQESLCFFPHSPLKTNYPLSEYQGSDSTSSCPPKNHPIAPSLDVLPYSGYMKDVQARFLTRQCPCQSDFNQCFDPTFLTAHLGVG